MSPIYIGMSPIYFTAVFETGGCLRDKAVSIVMSPRHPLGILSVEFSNCFGDVSGVSESVSEGVSQKQGYLRTQNTGL